MYLPQQNGQSPFSLYKPMPNAMERLVEDITIDINMSMVLYFKMYSRFSFKKECPSHEPTRMIWIFLQWLRFFVVYTGSLCCSLHIHQQRRNKQRAYLFMLNSGTSYCAFFIGLVLFFKFIPILAMKPQLRLVREGIESQPGPADLGIFEFGNPDNKH